MSKKVFRLSLIIIGCLSLLPLFLVQVLSKMTYQSSLLELKAQFIGRQLNPKGPDPAVTAPFSIPGPGYVTYMLEIDKYRSPVSTQTFPWGVRKQGTSGWGPPICDKQVGGKLVSNGVEVAAPIEGSITILKTVCRVNQKVEGLEAGLYPVTTGGTWELQQQLAQKTRLTIHYSPAYEEKKDSSVGKITTEAIADQDTYVNFLDDKRATNYAGNPQLATYSSNCNNWTTQSYLEFRLDVLPKASVTSAKLRLFAEVSHNRACGGPWSADPVFALRRVTSGWRESKVTYNQQPAVDPLIVAKASLNGVKGVPGANVRGWVEFDVTELYQQWATSRTPNFGVRVSQENPVCMNCTYAYFFSANHPDAARRPRLVVTGEPPASIR